MTTAESAISQTAAQVAIKANQSDLDTATGRLTTAEAELTIQSGKIASKVSQTDFNKVDGRLVSAESTLTQQAGLIASKVSQTDFNKVAGRLTSAETAITQSKNEIALKASKTEVSSIAKDEAERSKTTNHGYRYKEDIIIYGDSDKYYPVIIKGGDQSVKRDIVIKRGYSELAPPDWNSPTHRGGLTLKIKTNFGGWGGANYS